MCAVSRIVQTDTGKQEREQRKQKQLLRESLEQSHQQACEPVEQLEQPKLPQLVTDSSEEGWSGSDSTAQLSNATALQRTCTLRPYLRDIKLQQIHIYLQLPLPISQLSVIPSEQEPTGSGTTPPKQAQDMAGQSALDKGNLVAVVNEQQAKTRHVKGGGDGYDSDASKEHYEFETPEQIAEQRSCYNITKAGRKKGIGAVCAQTDPQHQHEYMVACISRSLNKHEVEYEATKGEALAVVYAVKTIHPRIHGAPSKSSLTLGHSHTCSANWSSMGNMPDGQCCYKATTSPSSTDMAPNTKTATACHATHKTAQQMPQEHVSTKKIYRTRCHSLSFSSPLLQNGATRLPNTPLERNSHAMQPSTHSSPILPTGSAFSTIRATVIDYVICPEKCRSNTHHHVISSNS